MKRSRKYRSDRSILSLSASAPSLFSSMCGFFIPVLLSIVMTIAKYFLMWFTALFYPSIVLPYDPSSISFYFELVANAVLAPIIFKFLDLFSYMLIAESDI